MRNAIRSMVSRWQKRTGGSRYTPFVGRDFANYFEQVRQGYGGLANGFSYYRELVEPLATDRTINVLPAYQLAAAAAEDGRLIALRHDIDADPITGLRLARHLARLGVCGSFYFLHTAQYYGQFYQDVFIRNPQMAEWLLGYIVSGCEIGLHNDVLGASRQTGISPVAILESELAWMRSHGAVIRGTAAHNSILGQGVENYEVFAEHRLWRRRMATENGRSIRLGAIRMADAGLSYEGTFAAPRPRMNVQAVQAFASDIADAGITHEAWMRNYLTNNPYCRWTVDFQLWLLGRDRWVIAGGERYSDVFQWDCDLDAVHAFIRQLPKGTRSLIVLHPEYFGDYSG